VLDFGRWKGFGESVGYHLVGWAIDEVKGIVFNDPTNKVETDVNMFGASMELMITSKHDGRSIVRKEW
jgi:hypothetical protein